DVAVERGRGVVGHGVGAPYLAHHLELAAVDLPREVRADGAPGVAAVVAAEQLVGGEVEAGVRVRADDQRRVPVPAQRRLAAARLRLDEDLLAALAVVAAEAAVLRLGVDDVRVLGIHLRLEAVAALGDEPVRIADAVLVVGARRSAEAEVVLGAAVDVVERLVVVEAHAVELRDRQVALEVPARAAVPGLGEAAVAADQQVIGVGGVDPHHVVVDVLVLLAERPEGLAAVLAGLEQHVHGVDAVGIEGIDEQLLIVLRAVRDVVAALLPTAAGVGRAEEAAGLADGLDDGVDGVRLRRREGEADAPHVLLGQAGGELLPGGAAVGGPVDAALGAAVDQGPDVAAPLVGGGVEHVGVARVHHHVGDAGVLADRQHLLPGLAAVGGLVEAAVAARRPQRALGRHVDGVRVAGIDEDLADVLGTLEPDVLPTLAAVDRLVDAVAVGDAALAVVLAAA